LHIGKYRLLLQLRMEEHIWTKISDEVDKIFDMEQLELINFDGGELVNYFTTYEVSLFHGVICVRI